MTAIPVSRSALRSDTVTWRDCFATPGAALATLAVATAAAALLLPLMTWAVTDAVWSGTAADCRVPGAGACWAFIGRKLRFILFGLYPAGEQWRPLAATVVLIGLLVATAVPRWWGRTLMWVWAGGITAFVLLMRGGVGGIPQIATRLWGGLPLTLGLTAFGLALGFPLGVLLALARRSAHLIPRAVGTAVVEVIRGVPVIAVLYLAALIVPLALPRGLEVDKLLLALAGMAVFAGAYLSEAVRSGLQMISRGQLEAASALGLTWWQARRLVILPQALRVVVPSFVSIAIGFFQDTSLVVVIGVFDLLNTTRVAAEDPAWLGFQAEAYLFAGLIYFVLSWGLSRFGRRLERRLRT